MSPAPCGCELIAQSYKAPNDEIRKQLQEEGEELRRRWGCHVPVDGHAYENTEELEDHPGFSPRETLERVQQLTGVPCKTCPCASARDPDVHTVLLCRKYRDKGQLDAVADVPLSAVLADCMEIVDAAVNELEAEATRRAEANEEPYDRKTQQSGGGSL